MHYVFYGGESYIESVDYPLLTVKLTKALIVLYSITLALAYYLAFWLLQLKDLDRRIQYIRSWSQSMWLAINLALSPSSCRYVHMYCTWSMDIMNAMFLDGESMHLWWIHFIHKSWEVPKWYCPLPVRKDGEGKVLSKGRNLGTTLRGKKKYSSPWFKSKIFPLPEQFIPSSLHYRSL